MFVIHIFNVFHRSTDLIGNEIPISHKSYQPIKIVYKDIRRFPL